MKSGFDTIGNATIIAYDDKPILVTDPWIQGSAYFGSWRLSHAVPEEQRKNALLCQYVWVSHGHPDHLNPDSIPLFKGKTILVPDHVGGRIRRDLIAEGHDVRVLPDRKWIQLSPKIKVLCIADLGQDAILLIDINGRLLINTNDCGDNGWGGTVKRIARKYDKAFLLCLASFGDADMMNYFSESGERILPEAAKKLPFGHAVSDNVLMFNATHYIPSSSMHKYQRTDSDWANEYTAEFSDIANGFDTSRCRLMPAFIRYDCEDDTHECINPPALTNLLHPPEAFGDNWSDELEKEDIVKATDYFRAVEHLAENINHITLRVGRKDHQIKLSNKPFVRGVIFEVPRASLMTSIRYEIFEDLLIGNFMKTTLQGQWPAVSLHPYLPGYLCKYADNGRAKTKEEVERYVAAYKRRNFGLRMKIAEGQLKKVIRSITGEKTATFRLAQGIYQAFRKRSFR